MNARKLSQFLLTSTLALGAAGVTREARAADIMECTCIIELWSRNDWSRPLKPSTYVVSVDGHEIVNQTLPSPFHRENEPKKLTDAATVTRYFLDKCPDTVMSPWAFIHAPIDRWSYPELSAQVSISPHVKYSNGGVNFVWSGGTLHLPNFAQKYSDAVKQSWVERMNKGDTLDIILFETIHAMLQENISALGRLTERLNNLPQELVTEDLKAQLQAAFQAVSSQDYERASAQIADLEERLTILESQH